MTAKPTTVPGWAPSDPSKVVEPAGGDKTDGFDPGEKPPAQWFNWFWQLVSGWVAYLKDGVLTGETGQPAISATGGTGATDAIIASTTTQTAIRGVSLGTGTAIRGDGSTTGRGVLGTCTSTQDAVRGQNLSSGYGVNGTSSTGVGVHGRATGGTGAGVEGSSFGGAGVSGSADGSGSGVKGVSSTGIGVEGISTGVGVAGTSSGVTPGVSGISATGPGVYGFKGSTSGDSGIATDGYLRFDGSAPAAATAISNKITPGNVCKAWGVFTTNGAGAVTLNEGFNIASIAIVAGDVQVNLATPFTNTNYAPIAQLRSSSRLAATAILDADTFYVTAINLSTLAAINFSSEGWTGHFHVYGRQ